MCVRMREGESGDEFFGRCISSAQQGCRECLAGLFETFERFLRQRARRELRDDPGATELRWKMRDSDLFQQSVLEAQRDIKNFRGKTQAEFMKWLFQIIVHNCEDLRRYYQAGGKRDPNAEVSLNHPRHAQRYANELTANEPEPAEAAIAQEEEELLAEALLKLPAPYGRIVVWRHFDDLSFVEIGKRLECPEATVRRMYHYGVYCLRAALEQRDKAATARQATIRGPGTRAAL